ncbi:hypothetical protein JCM10449v2_001010 [Rhodotorula kratochvilovae]
MAQVKTGRFAGQIPAELICPCCSLVAYPPVIVCRAAHLLCKNCSDHGGRRCEVCGGELLQAPLRSRAATLKLDEYTFLCRNEDLGCPWRGKVSTEERHATNLCGFRSMTCRRCKGTYRADQLRQHDEVCPDATITCAEGGSACLGTAGSGVFRRCQAEQHARVCANRPCRNFATCKTRATSANLEAHEAACDGQLQKQAGMQQNFARLQTFYDLSEQARLNLDQRVQLLDAKLASTNTALEKERKRRRALQDECTDLLDDLRQERSRFAPSRRTRDADRFAPPKRAYSSSKEVGTRDRWARDAPTQSAYAASRSGRKYDNAPPPYPGRYADPPRPF